MIWLGKLTDAQMPARSMSATRAAGSQQPRRIWSKRTGSIGESSFGRPTTALSPTCGKACPSKTQISLPFEVVLT